MSARAIDVIDVNRTWTAYVGSRRWGYSVGIVQAAGYQLALKAARARWPNIHIRFVEEQPEMRCATLRRQAVPRALKGGIA